MSTSFQLSESLIIVYVEFKGPADSVSARLALDTGATNTLLSEEALILLGYNLQATGQQSSLTAVTGVASVGSVVVDMVSALDQTVRDFPVIAYTLPSSADLDGLLGLDFLRDRVLTIDFRAGMITLV